MKKRCRSAFLAVVFLACSVLNTVWVHGLRTHGVVYAHCSINIPVIDGRWTTPTEWADATEIKVENGSTGQTLYIRLKYNGTYLYVLLDFVTDYTPSTYDYGGICFDTKDDGGILAAWDDFSFIQLVGQVNFLYIFQGTGTGNTTGESWMIARYQAHPETEGMGGFSGINDPYQGKAHRIIEFRIPRDGSRRNWFEVDFHYGFYAFVSDYHSETLLEWPIGAGGKNIRLTQTIGGIGMDVPPAPERWGDIVFPEELWDNYNALLLSNSSLQSTINQLQSDYHSLNNSFNVLNDRFEDLRIAYSQITYLTYASFAIVIVLTAVTVYQRLKKERYT